MRREVRSSIMQWMETSWDTRQDSQHQRCLMKRRHRLQRDICSQWELKHTHDELDEDLNLCYKVEDKILYTRWIHRILVAQEATCHSGTKCFNTQSMKGIGRMMLSFRGSDCRRSQVSTWYDRMDRLLMSLGFTDSKQDSNLCFKVEGRRPVMLLLYVDDLFLTEKRNSLKLQGDLLLSLR